MVLPDKGIVMTKKEFNKWLQEMNELEAAELKRRVMVKSKFISFDPFIKHEKGSCFAWGRPALPHQAHCEDCINDLLTLRCINCGERLYEFDPVKGVLEENSWDGDYCFHCFRR